MKPSDLLNHTLRTLFGAKATAVIKPVIFVGGGPDIGTDMMFACVAIIDLSAAFLAWHLEPITVQGGSATSEAAAMELAAQVGLSALLSTMKQLPAPDHVPPTEDTDPPCPLTLLPSAAAHTVAGFLGTGGSFNDIDDLIRQEALLPVPSNYTIKVGNILGATTTYLAQQLSVNAPRVPLGLAKTLFTDSPNADTYTKNQHLRTAGSFSAHVTTDKPTILNMYTQESPGGPSQFDSEAHRAKLFCSVLSQFSEHNFRSISFAEGIASGMAQGRWEVYSMFLRHYARNNPRTKVQIWRLPVAPPAADAPSTPTTPPTPTPTHWPPNENSSAALNLWAQHAFGGKAQPKVSYTDKESPDHAKLFTATISIDFEEEGVFPKWAPCRFMVLTSEPCRSYKLAKRAAATKILKHIASSPQWTASAAPTPSSSQHSLPPTKVHCPCGHHIADYSDLFREGPCNTVATVDTLSLCCNLQRRTRSLSYDHADVFIETGSVLGTFSCALCGRGVASLQENHQTQQYGVLMAKLVSKPHGLAFQSLALLPPPPFALYPPPSASSCAPAPAAALLEPFHDDLAQRSAAAPPVPAPACPSISTLNRMLTEPPSATPTAWPGQQVVAVLPGANKAAEGAAFNADRPEPLHNSADVANFDFDLSILDNLTDTVPVAPACGNGAGGFAPDKPDQPCPGCVFCVPFAACGNGLGGLDTDDATQTCAGCLHCIPVVHAVGGKATRPDKPFLPALRVDFGQNNTVVVEGRLSSDTVVIEKELRHFGFHWLPRKQLWLRQCGVDNLLTEATQSVLQLRTIAQCNTGPGLAAAIKASLAADTATSPSKPFTPSRLDSRTHKRSNPSPTGS
jgi:hypothetical protein